jgi:hypothetical protein
MPERVVCSFLVGQLAMGDRAPARSIEPSRSRNTALTVCLHETCADALQGAGDDCDPLLVVLGRWDHSTR